MWAFQKGNQKLLPLGLLDKRRPQTIRHRDCDSHHQSFNTGGDRLTVMLSFTELAKLWSAVLELPPLLKTSWRNSELSCPSKKSVQLPSILPSTPAHIHQLSLVFTGHFFWFSRGCSLRIPIALIGEKSSSRTGRWGGRRGAVWNPNICSLFFTRAVLTRQTPWREGSRGYRWQQFTQRCLKHRKAGQLAWERM